MIIYGESYLVSKSRLPLYLIFIKIWIINVINKIKFVIQ